MNENLRYFGRNEVFFYNSVSIYRLAVARACKNTVVTNFMDSLTSACHYFENSPNQKQYFERFIDYCKDGLSVVAIIVTMSQVYLKHIMSKDMKRMKIMTYFLSFIVAMLDSICNPHLYEDFYKYLEYETCENWC